ncbi:leucine-rich repeat protein 1-like isoform X2 [Physella acuta]|uniref:leucine-rich repeat protein 1-like isoform X2 n=1 Tax=Physella acuta TaxID=109671 RepID=UPI0027DE1ED8|nr:leucine-rich repeat protein 1-like isoform X2 [Physella acuta]
MKYVPSAEPVLVSKMRFKCHVSTCNRLLPSLNLKKPNRSQYTQVSIGVKPSASHQDGRIVLMLCTTQNMNGTKYLLYRNVEQIFSKFLNEGKVTLRLSSPSEDISFSKADPNDLKLFVQLVRLAAEGKELPTKAMSTLAPATGKQIEKPVTSLHVDKPSQYPMAFPKSLKHLAITCCSLRRISAQVTALTHLACLNLSSNQISQVPEALGQLVNLDTCDLSDNKLTSFPPVFYTSQLRHTLASVNLKANTIQTLPSEIAQLVKLHTLNVSHNQLKRVPESVARMKTLRHLFLSDNMLDFLPGSLLTRTLETADFSNNSFLHGFKGGEATCFPVPSLAESAARVIVHSRVPYSELDLDVFSIRYISQGHVCLCGRPCFESSVSQIQKRRQPCTLSYSGEEFPYLVYFCSRRCLLRFHTVQP